MQQMEALPPNCPADCVVPGLYRVLLQMGSREEQHSLNSGLLSWAQRRDGGAQ